MSRGAIVYTAALHSSEPEDSVVGVFTSRHAACTWLAKLIGIGEYPDDEEADAVLLHKLADGDYEGVLAELNHKAECTNRPAYLDVLRAEVDSAPESHQEAREADQRRTQRGTHEHATELLGRVRDAVWEKGPDAPWSGESAGNVAEILRDGGFGPDPADACLCAVCGGDEWFVNMRHVHEDFHVCNACWDDCYEARSGVHYMIRSTTDRDTQGEPLYFNLNHRHQASLSEASARTADERSAYDADPDCHLPSDAEWVRCEPRPGEAE